MEPQNLWTVLVTAITVLGSTQAWNFYSKKLEKKKEEELVYRYDCKERITKLEYLLEESSKEKDELRNMVLRLSTELAALRARLELMEKKGSDYSPPLHKKQNVTNCQHLTRLAWVLFLLFYSEAKLMLAIKSVWNMFLLEITLILSSSE